MPNPVVHFEIQVKDAAAGQEVGGHEKDGGHARRIPRRGVAGDRNEG